MRWPRPKTRKKRAIKRTESLEMRWPRPETRKKTRVYASSAQVEYIKLLVEAQTSEYLLPELWGTKLV